jgi:hypothetical protein
MKETTVLCCTDEGKHSTDRGKHSTDKGTVNTVGDKGTPQPWSIYVYTYNKLAPLQFIDPNQKIEGQCGAVVESQIKSLKDVGLSPVVGSF